MNRLYAALLRFFRFCGPVMLLSLCLSSAAGQPGESGSVSRSGPSLFRSLRQQLAQSNLPDTVRVNVLNRLALVSAGEEGLATGQRRAADALAYARRIGYLRGELVGLCLVAKLAREAGDFALAFKHYRAGLEIAQAHHLCDRYHFFYENMGATWLSMGDYSYALKLLRISLLNLRRYPPPPADSAAVAATLYSHLAAAYYHLNRYPEALAAGRLAVATVASAEYRASASRLVADLLDRQGPHLAANDSAIQRLRRAVLIHRRTNQVFEEAHAALELAGFYLQHRQLAEATGHAARAEALARRVKAASLRAEALTILAKVATARGDYRAASTWKDQLAALNAALFSQEKARAVATLQARFEVEQQQRIQVLTRLNEQRAQLADAQQAKLALSIAGLLALGVLLAGGFALHLRLRKANQAIRRNSDELTQANHEIREQVREKEVLVQEIHHRVKNNLQLTDTLLAWQGRALGESSKALLPLLANTRARLQSMALVHEFLYRADDLANIRLDFYLESLLGSLHQSFSIPQRSIALSTDLAPHLMGAKDASAFGLLVNELVTNVYKHAFAQREEGALHVSLRNNPAGSGFCLRIVDNGVGIPPIDLSKQSDSLGLKLVTTLAKQLNAVIKAEAHCPTGTCVEVLTG